MNWGGLAEVLITLAIRKPFSHCGDGPQHSCHSDSSADLHEPMRGLERQRQQLHEVWREKEESDKGWLVRERGNRY